MVRDPWEDLVDEVAEVAIDEPGEEEAGEEGVLDEELAAVGEGDIDVEVEVGGEGADADAVIGDGDNAGRGR
ncbi:hypothetical protein ACHAPU_006774 [Fusarium lateritium]